MRIIVMPSVKPWPVGYAAFSGADDFAVTGHPYTWPTGQVSMNTGLGGNSITNNNLVWDFQSEVWLGPGKGGGGGESFIRSTDDIGSSWVSWSAQKPSGIGFTDLRLLMYDFYHQRVIAMDTGGRVSWAPTYSGPWSGQTGLLAGGNPAKWDIGWIGGQTVIACGGTVGTFYTLNGGSSWASIGGATSNSNGGICFNPVTDTWWNWEGDSGQINETATNDISGGFIDTGADLTTGNKGNLICNPDTGTMLALDLANFRSWWRYPNGTGPWTLINTGNGMPLVGIQSLIYDRSIGQWLLGDESGRIWSSSNDGLTFTVRNGNAAINDGSIFFDNFEHLGYAQRYLQTHVVP